MNKYQEALKKVTLCDKCISYSCDDCMGKKYIVKLQELVNKEEAIKVKKKME